MGLITININNANNNDLEGIQDLLLEITKKLNSIMATIADLTTQVDALQVALDNEQAQIAQAIASLQQAVTDLTALVAEGGTTEERQALADKLVAIKQDLEGTIPDA